MVGAKKRHRIMCYIFVHKIICKKAGIGYTNHWIHKDFKKFVDSYLGSDRLGRSKRINFGLLDPKP